MSNAFSDNIAWQSCEARRSYGTLVHYAGRPHSVFTEPVSGSQCGVEGLPVLIKDQLEIYIASLDPRVFRFNPDEFAPFTVHLAPVMHTDLAWHSFTYHITRVNYDDSADDTLAISVYALRRIW